MGIALKKMLDLPKLKKDGTVEYKSDGITVDTKEYRFEEVLYGDKPQLKRHALKKLNEMQDWEYGQSPEFKIMLELLGGLTQTAPLIDPNFKTNIPIR